MRAMRDESCGARTAACCCAAVLASAAASADGLRMAVDARLEMSSRMVPSGAAAPAAAQAAPKPRREAQVAIREAP